MADKREELRARIHKEMTADYSNALEKNFDLAKQFVRVTREGKIDVIVRENLGGKDQILLYLIGKLYAKEAGFSPADDVGNKELLDELGAREGSLLPWLKGLRDKHRIKQLKKGKWVSHVILINNVEQTLKSIEKKIKKAV